MTQRHSKKTLVHKTLKDLIVDLRTNGNEPEAVAIEGVITGSTKNEIFQYLKNSESELFKVIPVELLSSSESGKKYLQILSMFNNDLKRSEPEQALHPELPSNLRDILTSNDNNSELMSLAQELMSDPNLTNELQSLQTMDMSGMMNLFQTVGAFMQTKTESGQLDLDRLSTQANDMFAQIRTAPEIQQIFESNPQLDILLRTMTTDASGTDDYYMRHRNDADEETLD